MEIENKTHELLQIGVYPFIKLPGLEIRLNEDGTLDEIVMYNDEGKCVYHLEQMSDKSYWMGCYPDAKGGGIHANIGVDDNGKLWANAYDNGGKDTPYWGVPVELTEEEKAEMKAQQDAYISKLRNKPNADD